jgi:hypothetical protein
MLRRLCLPDFGFTVILKFCHTENVRMVSTLTQLLIDADRDQLSPRERKIKLVASAMSRNVT